MRTLYETIKIKNISHNLQVLTAQKMGVPARRGMSSDSLDTGNNDSLIVQNLYMGAAKGAQEPKKRTFFKISG